MNENLDVIFKVEQMINTLSKSLPVSEIEGGWTEEARLTWLNFFRKLHDYLLHKQPLEDDNYVNLIRSMDHWGIVDGNLLDKAVEIQRDLKSIK